MTKEGNNIVLSLESIEEFKLEISNMAWYQQLSYSEQCMLNEAITEISRKYIEERMSFDEYKRLSSMVAEYRKLLKFYVEEATQRKYEVEDGVEIIGRPYNPKLTIEAAVQEYIGKPKEEMEKYNGLILEIEIPLRKKRNELLKKLRDLYEGKGSLGKLLNKNEEDYECLKPPYETDAEWDVETVSALASVFNKFAAGSNKSAADKIENVPDFVKKMEEVVSYIKADGDVKGKESKTM